MFADISKHFFYEVFRHFTEKKKNKSDILEIHSACLFKRQNMDKKDKDQFFFSITPDLFSQVEQL